MSDEIHNSHNKAYFLVFLGLTVLTVIEVVIPSIETLSYFAKASSLTFLAVGKAFLVAYFFMHLKMERAWLKFIAAIPISAALYAAVVMIESFNR